ncbi:Protein downstream neighbor of Son [Quillaja saponaria]|uniref:Protein downstream neighbor of Son n=1 Tax=Quillaja saponaria TaxID=32244 RepID=A0AAD7PY67_QUISA|nr:Protein downstream neighbor of Son [Quillaja saponaria]
MAKVAARPAPGALTSDSLRTGGGALNGGAAVKRKTPSELRGEQLKRVNAIELVDESPPPFLGSSNEVDNGTKRSELSRNPRYIDTRVNEVFPSKKSRFRMLSGKENAKENTSIEQTIKLKNLNLSAQRQHKTSCPENASASAEVSRDSPLQSCQTIGKCSESKFRTVTELSTTGDKLSGLATIDMDKALRGLAAPEPRVSSDLAADLSGRSGDPKSTFMGNFFSECQVPGQMAPLDLTLKTNMRVVSSSSVNWIHRSVCGSQFPLQHGHLDGQNVRNHLPLSSSSQVFDSKVLKSWIYPQSLLPPSLISMLSSLATGVEMEFLRKRQAAWEESFRNLYYMLRNNVCGIFYVRTAQFVVMFTGGDGTGRSKCSCSAYISQSTRGLRSLLREHDVCFSMPLCHSKVEQVTTEDLVELSEIEKHNLGQTRRLSSFPNVDNSPESLLVFSGNKGVHGLYDFLLNYRSFSTSLAGVDVPVLCSPVPFHNAALSSPEINCMEMKRVEHFAAPSNAPIRKDGESGGLCSSIEIKDAFLPPWIICGICAIMGSEGRSFEASFLSEPTSIGLNVALEAVCGKLDIEAPASKSSEKYCTFGIPEAIVTSCLRSCSLKGLKYSNGSYTASLSPV